VSTAMRIALIADAFPPMRTSCAIQLRDLSQEMARQGHLPTVIVPSAALHTPWELDEMNGVRVVRLKAPRTKGINYVRRTLGELLLPFAMLRSLRESPLAKERWDGVVWYSPTIFLGPIVHAIKTASKCRSYLIIRDIFPQFAVDLGLLSNGPVYHFFRTIEKYQYSVADVIGVQSPGNLSHFDTWMTKEGRQAEVLQNWLCDSQVLSTRVAISKGPLAGRKIFVYAGIMSVQQGLDIFLDLAERLLDRKDIGFLFVGTGVNAGRLAASAQCRQLENVLFHDEIEPEEIPGLYRQCHVGLVALDKRHKTHNIPGKFVSYMVGGLPVLASINPGNDLAELIEREGVGRVCTSNSVDELRRKALEVADELVNLEAVAVRCRALAGSLFSPATAVSQIVDALRKR